MTRRERKDRWTTQQRRWDRVKARGHVRLTINGSPKTDDYDIGVTRCGKFVFRGRSPEKLVWKTPLTIEEGGFKELIHADGKQTAGEAVAQGAEAPAEGACAGVAGE